MAKNRVEKYAAELKSREELFAVIRAELASMSKEECIAIVEEVYAAYASGRWPDLRFRETVLIAAFAFLGAETVEMQRARETRDN
jgi:hypothetical protein